MKNRFFSYAFTFVMAATIISCTPTKVAEKENRQETPQEAYIRTFPNDIVKTKPGCLKPDFSKLSNHLTSGSASLKATFFENGVPEKIEVISAHLSFDQSKVIEKAFMKCKYEIDSAVSIPNGFQRDYFYEWNEKPLVGLTKCMFGSQPYPIASRRFQEEGVTLAAYSVDSKSAKVTTSITQSSGFNRLDQATLSLLNNCLSHEEVRSDINKDTLIQFKQNWRITP